MALSATYIQNVCAMADLFIEPQTSNTQLKPGRLYLDPLLASQKPN